MYALKKSLFIVFEAYSFEWYCIVWGVVRFKNGFFLFGVFVLFSNILNIKMCDISICKITQNITNVYLADYF